MDDFFLSNEQVELSIALKLGMIQKNSLPNLSLEQFKLVLVEMKWKAGMPRQLHEAINDIFACTADEIVAYLAKKAVIDARKKSLSEYASLLGGNP